MLIMTMTMNCLTQEDYWQTDQRIRQDKPCTWLNSEGKVDNEENNDNNDNNENKDNDNQSMIMMKKLLTYYILCTMLLEIDDQCRGPSIKDKDHLAE